MTGAGPLPGAALTPVLLAQATAAAEPVPAASRVRRFMAASVHDALLSLRQSAKGAWWFREAGMCAPGGSPAT
ncbi:hypothetical protein GCM10010222_11970 [Streptomyces tanashiensis]|nr:hypothetical protein GCM10010222_11970 [Streptomyces tanashiensis]